MKNQQVMKLSKMTTLRDKPLWRRVTLWLSATLMIGVAASAAAHKYFFAITEINHNQLNDSFEIIHQLTAHDIENTIAEKHNITFNPEHPKYDALIKAYVEQRFVLTSEQQALDVNWIGLEVVRDKIVVYQEAHANRFLAPLVVKNELLVDTYPKQINTVNFVSGETKHSLTFNKSQRIATITNNN